jgi:ATP-binding cassette subfamily B (MDR/TAP) protein 1
VEESLSSVRTVYSFAAEEKTERAYEAALDKTYKLGLKASLAKGLALGAQGILFFAWALMFW